VINYAKELNRRELVLAVWAAEFTRALSGVAPHDAPILRRLAENAAKSADRAVEALRLLIDVKFRLAEPDELESCYMPWKEFVSCCETNAFTSDDGFGELATTDHHVSDVRVHPRDALDESYVRPDWATHVCWYNK